MGVSSAGSSGAGVGFVSALEAGVVARRRLVEREVVLIEQRRVFLEAARLEVVGYVDFINAEVLKAAGEGKLLISVNLHSDEVLNFVFHALLVCELYCAGFGVVERRVVPVGSDRVGAGGVVYGMGLVGLDISWARVWDDPVLGGSGVGGSGSGMGRGRVLDLPKGEGVGDGPVVAGPVVPVVRGSVVGSEVIPAPIDPVPVPPENLAPATSDAVSGSDLSARRRIIHD